MLTDKETVAFWAGYIVQMRNINELMKRSGKYNNEVMEELLNDVCDIYGVHTSMLDDLDYEYTKKIPLQLIKDKLKNN